MIKTNPTFNTTALPAAGRSLPGRPRTWPPGSPPRKPRWAVSRRRSPGKERAAEVPEDLFRGCTGPSWVLYMYGTYLYTYRIRYMYTSIYVYVCVCVYLCIYIYRVRRRKERERETHTHANKHMRYVRISTYRVEVFLLLGYLLGCWDSFYSC